jgi:malate dehydrogenase (oxaloacetate-decarboxylating)
MILAAARSVAELVDPSRLGAPLLPPVESLRGTSHAVAVAVARAAVREGVAGSVLDEDVDAHVRGLMWKPEYRPGLPA